MYNIHPTDFLIFSFDREAFQSKVLFQRPRVTLSSYVMYENATCNLQLSSHQYFSMKSLIILNDGS